MIELPRLESFLSSGSKAVDEFPFNMRFAKINNWKTKNEVPANDSDSADENVRAMDSGDEDDAAADQSLKNPFDNQHEPEKKESLANPF